MNYNRLTSLDALRAEKRSTLKSMTASSKRMKRRVKNSVLPENNMFLRSNMRYLRYVGYGIMAFKTVNTVRHIMSFFSGRR
ncbi:MAG: hypothetical protein NC206_02560 [Bacteroides sp.]|nr:hypothetical protein [Roseburia sp.]MCM1345945.1 hypothetical protein [Bacteroides sp.]MCM1420309.1 hypothetical protein [Bacteroides sp.]